MEALQQAASAAGIQATGQAFSDVATVAHYDPRTILKTMGEANVCALVSPCSVTQVPEKQPSVCLQAEPSTDGNK